MRLTMGAHPAILLLLSAVCHAGLLQLRGAPKEEGKHIVTDALGNKIDLYGRWWTPRDRDIFENNININTYQPPSVKGFTETGFKKQPIPEHLWKEISTFFENNKDNEINEGTVPGYIVGKTTWMTYVTEHLRMLTFETMKPILEKWAGVGLTESAVYGIRKYTKGSTLQVHVDAKGTHIISAILHVHEEYHTDDEERWPLQIQDHEGGVHEVTLKPGEMVLYESAKLIHGRPKPLQGKGYWNMFCHFRPSNNEHMEM